MNSNMPHCRRRLLKCMRRDNHKCSKASWIEAVWWREVEDKLQSCGLKWFVASAKGDKFCPLCFTNHWSLTITLLMSGQPLATWQAYAVHSLCTWSPMHSLTDCDTINPNTPPCVPRQRKGSLILPSVCFRWLAGSQKMHTTAQKFPYVLILITCPFHASSHVSTQHTCALSCISVIDAMTRNKQAI